MTAAVGLTASAAPSASAAVSATGTAACGVSSTQRIWQAFAAFRDPADYWLAPGGDFESGARGWGLTGARVVRGNDTSGVLGGGRSLALGVGLISTMSTAVSPPFCITAAHPTFRYLLRANGAVGALSTFIRYRAADGSTQEEQVRSRTATTLLPGRWKPSDLQPLATRLPMAQVGGVAMVQLVFRTPVSLIGAGYQVDNVLVDPYRTR